MYQYPFQQTNVLPTQQILQANGKASIDAIRMQPNSSVLIMDTTAPIVWLCVSDGLGNVSSTAYDITPHKEPEQVNVEDRLARIERTLLAMEARYGKSDDAEIDDEQFITSQANVANAKKRRKSTGDVKSNDEF